MHTGLLVEWDNPKCEERNAKRKKFVAEVIRPYWDKLLEKKNIKVEPTGWAENTGHFVVLYNFETVEDFSKVWGDERWHQNVARWTYLVDNARMRLLRSYVTMPEDLK